jgi:hypothetical protein
MKNIKFDKDIWIITACTVIIVVMFGLILSHNETKLTQVYFDDYENLPVNINSDTDYSFSFMVKNLEKKPVDYEYNILQEIDNKTIKIIDSGEFSLKKYDEKRFSNKFRIDHEFNISKIKVELNNSNTTQEIHFFVYDSDKFIG